MGEICPKMSRRYLASYKKLAAKRGHKDPLEYIWMQYHAQMKAGNHAQALELATMLLPYGHGKQAPVTQEGDSVSSGVFVLD